MNKKIYKTILIAFSLFFGASILANASCKTDKENNIEGFSEMAAYIAPYSSQKKIDQLMEKEIAEHLVK